MFYDLTLKRSPEDLYEVCEAYRDFVSITDLDNALLRKEETYKYFIDEVWPLAKFCKATLDNTYLVQPVQGNQGFDASVYRDGEIEFNIEVAYPQNGAARAKETRAMINGGIPKLKIFSPKELELLLGNIESVCISKSKKDYSDCWLLFNVVTGAVVEERISEFVPSMNKVIDTIQKYQFTAKAIYVFFSPFDKVVKINA
jgi:hypothetical protein